ncbi:lysophospholipid acyltransferase family protein [bacterium]|nr:lysophospholipid acyltransferase family protein [bacterium]
MKRVKRWLKHNVGWVTLKIVIALINILSLRMMYGLANGLAGLAWILRVRRQIVFNNLNRAFGKEKDPHEIRAIAREAYRNIAKNICELLRVFKFSQEEINKMFTPLEVSRHRPTPTRGLRPVGRRLPPMNMGGLLMGFTIQGREYLDAALARGKGAIGLSAHLGNFPLMGAKLVQEGYPCASFIYGASEARVVKLFFDIGRHLGISLIPTSPSYASVRQSLKWLRENKLLSIQADRDTPQGVFVDFFGYPAATPIGPVVLAKRTGATVLPMFVVREMNNRHRIIFGPPVELEVTGNKEKDILVNSAKFTKIIESYVRKYPEQWLWTYRRWKTVPEKQGEQG